MFDCNTTKRMSSDSKSSGKGVGVEFLAAKICLVARQCGKSLVVVRCARVILIVVAQHWGMLFWIDEFTEKKTGESKGLQSYR